MHVHGAVISLSILKNLCAACRPLNRILIAQRVALPQMFVSIAVAALHFGVNHLLVNTLGLGFLGAAWAIGIASFNTTALTAAWVALAGMRDRVWGKPTWQAFQVPPLGHAFPSIAC